jgi:hypothetical protein
VFALVGAVVGAGIAATLLSIVLTTLAVQGLQPPSDAAGFAMYNQQLQQSMLVQASSVVGILVTFWSAYIWVPAVQRARNVDRRGAIVAVAIPVAVSVLIGVFGIVASGLA